MTLVFMVLDSQSRRDLGHTYPFRWDVARWVLPLTPADRALGCDASHTALRLSMIEVMAPIFNVPPATGDARVTP
jgi:hypothetical protein